MDLNRQIYGRYTRRILLDATKLLESGNNEFGLAYNISEKMIFYRIRVKDTLKLGN